MAVKEQDSGLRSELCAYYEWGLSVMIDEKICQTEDISQICSVLEEDHYMPGPRPRRHFQAKASRPPSAAPTPQGGKRGSRSGGSAPAPLQKERRNPDFHSGKTPWSAPLTWSLLPARQKWTAGDHSAPRACAPAPGT